MGLPSSSRQQSLSDIPTKRARLGGSSPPVGDDEDGSLSEDAKKRLRRARIKELLAQKAQSNKEAQAVALPPSSESGPAENAGVVGSDDDEEYYREFVERVREAQALHGSYGTTPVLRSEVEVANNHTTDNAAGSEKRGGKRNMQQNGGSDKKEDRIVVLFKDHQLDSDEDSDGSCYAVARGQLEQRMPTFAELSEIASHKKELPRVDHSSIAYLPIEKNVYVQVKDITQMSDKDVEAFRKLNGNIRVRGRRVPRPISAFAQCGISEAVMKAFAKRGILTPLPVQMQALPALMAGRDALLIAETGSGKTLAYLLPAVRHALAQPPLKHKEGPVVLIMCPTRELAVQVSKEAKRIATPLALRCAAAYGGAPLGPQLSAIRKGAELLVATPGRLIDVLTLNGGRIMNLQRVTMVVVDEADRMLDLGFEPQLTKLLQNVRPDRQTVLVSATFPQYIQAVATKVLKKPVEIVVGDRGTVVSRIEQNVEVWQTEREKLLRLLQLLGEWHEHGSIIIFVNRQAEADELFAQLLKHGYATLVLHGGHDYADRASTLRDFKAGNVANILIATSVAARGIDVPTVVLIVNYTAPDHLEDYVHRVGRTARAGNIGVAYTFIMPTEAEKAEDLIRAVKQTGKEPSPALLALQTEFALLCNQGLAQKRRGKGFGGKGFRFSTDELSRQEVERRKAKADLLHEDEEAEAAAAADEDEDAPAEKSPEGDKPPAVPIPAPAYVNHQKIPPPRPSRSPAALLQALAQQAIPTGASRLSGLGPRGYVDPSTGSCVDELDINDYAQIARFKVSSKETLSLLGDAAGGASLQVKGRYCNAEESAAVLAAGGRRLYVEIVAPTVVIVQRAKHHLTQFLEAASIRTLGGGAEGRRPHQLVGRYTVV